MYEKIIYVLYLNKHLSQVDHILSTVTYSGANIMQQEYSN